MNTETLLDHAATLEIVQTQLEAILKIAPVNSAQATLAACCKRLLTGMQNDVEGAISARLPA